MFEEKTDGNNFKTESDFVVILAYQLWREWANSIENMSQEEKQEMEKHMAYFTKMTGAKKPSPAYLMYNAFISGIDKGIELANRLEKQDGKSKSPADAPTPTGQALKPTTEIGLNQL